MRRGVGLRRVTPCPSSGLPRAVQYDDLQVVLKEARKEWNVMVERTWEGWARGRAQRLLERLKGVACGC
jgi:hypothetical protein